jgi:hypothetical protein
LLIETPQLPRGSFQSKIKNQKSRIKNQHSAIANRKSQIENRHSTESSHARHHPHLRSSAGAREKNQAPPRERMGLGAGTTLLGLPAKDFD